MATWIDLYEATSGFVSKPKVVCLVVGEQSSFTEDRVRGWLNEYPVVHRSVQLSKGFDSLHSATYLISPSDETIREVVRDIKSGSSESYFISMPHMDKTPDTEFIKKKAQQNKMYYTISSPTSESAQKRMVSFFVVRWGVGTDAAYKVCSSLNFSPGHLYNFDKMFLLSTGGAMLPSTKTNALIDNLLGDDTETMVVQKLLTKHTLHKPYSREFTSRVLSHVSTLVNDSLVLKGAAEAGMMTFKELSQFTGLSMYEVSRSFELSEMYSRDRLEYINSVVMYGISNSDNMETLAVVSQALSK